MIHILAGIFGFVIFYACKTEGYPWTGLAIQLTFQAVIFFLDMYRITGKWRFWK